MNGADPGRINAAFESYAAWSAPGGYFGHCLSAPGLSENDVALMRQVWDAVNEPAHWDVADLVACRIRSEAALRSRFPWLGDRAVSAVSRAASYLWQ